MKLLLSLFLALSIAFPADAQVDELKKQLEELAKSQQNNKQSDDAEAAAQAAMLSSMFGNAEDLKLKEEYTFDFQIDWRVESSKEKEASEFKQFFSKNESYVGMQGEPTSDRNKNKEVSMVIDMENNYMIVLNEKDKQAMVMSTANQGGYIPQTEETTSSKDFKITKTGKTKTIATFLVEQYTYKKEDGQGEFWTTKDLKYKNGNFFNYFQSMNRNKKKDTRHDDWWNDQVEGYLLETRGTSNDGESFHMVATAVHKNIHVKHLMSDYQVINMTGMSNFMPKD